MDAAESVSPASPDYDLLETVAVIEPAKLRAIFDPLRGQLMDLVLERAATVSELAAAVGRPKSTIAHHVKVLVENDIFKVVRTRKVRAIEERFYGRVARTFYVGVIPLEDVTPLPWTNYLADAAAESVPAYHADTMWAQHMHARIPRHRANEFWKRVDEVIGEFARLPREGDTVYGFAVGLYPTEHPTLPEPD